MIFNQRCGRPLVVFILLFIGCVVSQDEDLSKLLKKYERQAEDLSRKHLEAFGLQPNQKHRAKRELPETLTTISEDLSVLINVTGLSNNLRITHPTHLKVFSSNGIFYLVVAGTDDNSLVTKVFRHNTSTSDYDELQILNTPTLTDIAVFSMDDGSSYMVLTEITACRFVALCTVLYKFNKDIQVFEPEQEIPSNGAILLETFVLDSVWCLVIINEQLINSTDQGVAYEWKGSYFDEVCKFPVNLYIVDVCAFTIHNLKFIAAASNRLYHRRVSEIFVYSHIAEDFIHYQYIYVEGALDFEFFSFGEGIEQEFFLALAVNRLKLDDEKSIIYKYYKGEFRIFQYVEANQAEKWHTIRTPDGRFQLLVLSSGVTARYFYYDGWCFRETTYQPYWDTIPAGVRDLCSHTVDGVAYLSVAGFQTDPDATNIYMFTFEQQNPVQELHDRATAAIEVAKQLVNDTDALIAKVESELDNLVALNSPEEQVITARKVFSADVNTIGSLNASALHGDSGSIFSEIDGLIIAELAENTTRRWPEIEAIIGRLQNFVTLSGDNQVVTGEKSFDAISAATVVSSSITVESNLINSHINLTELDQNLVLTDKPVIIDIPLTIAGDLVVLENLDIDGLINGVDVDNLVLKNGSNIIYGKKTFRNGLNIIGDLQVRGDIDGVAVNEDNIFLRDGEQHFSGHLIIEGDVRFNEDVRVDTLNGIDLYDLQENAVYKAYRNQTIIFTDYKDFLGNATAEGDVSIWGNHTIDGVNIREFEATTMQPDVEYNMTGKLTVQGNVTVEGNMFVNGTIDGLRIPEDVVLVNSSETQVLSGKLNFSSDVIVDVMHVLKSIDGIRSNLGENEDELDILLTTGGQTVLGHLTFANDVHIVGNVTVDNTLGGVDVDFLNKVVTKDTVQTIYGEKTFLNPVTIEGNLTVGLINDIDIVDLNERAVRADDDVIATLGQIIFLGEVEILGNLTTNGLHSFNGKTLSDLVLLDEDQVINGEKYFLTDTHTKDNVNVDGLINGIDLSELYANSAVVMNASGTVHMEGDYTFADDLYIYGNVTAPPEVNGILLTDIVTTTGSHTITSNITFLGDQTVEELVILGDLWVEGLVDGVDINDLDENTLKIYGDQVVTGEKHFTQNLTILGNLSVSGLINNVDIVDLANDAVYKTGYHEISGEKTFLNLVHLYSLNVTGLINGIDLDEFSRSVMLQGADQVITAPTIRFAEDVTIDNDLNVTGLVNNLDIEYLDSVAIRITDGVIPVEMHFEHLHVESCGINVTGLVDGIDLSEEAILIDKPGQVISGQKTFENTVTVGGDIDIDVINSINLTELLRTTVLYDSDQVITATKHIIGDMFVDGNMTVDGFFNSYKIDYLNEHLLQRDEELIVFTANVTVETLEVYNDVKTLSSLFCGQNLTDIRQSYLSKTLPQTVSASIHFADLEVNDDQFLDNDILVANSEEVIGHYVNDIDLSFMSSLTEEGETIQAVNGSVTFLKGFATGNITVLGTINGISLPNDAMLVAGNNVVTGEKTFVDFVIINGDLIMAENATIAGTDISAWAETVVYANQPLMQTVPLNFNDDLVFNDDLSVMGLINGVFLDSSTILLTTLDQTITGSMTFTNISFEDIWLGGLLNGLDVDELYNNTLYDVGDQEIAGMYFDGTPTFTNITLGGLIDDVDLLNLLENLEHMVQFDQFNESLEERCQAINELHEAQENSAVLIGCSEILTTISTTGHVSWDSFVIDDEQWLMMGTTGNGSSSCNPTILYKYNNTLENYVEQMVLYPSRADDVSSFTFMSLSLLVIASQGDYLEDCSFEITMYVPPINAPNASGSISVLLLSADTVSHYQKIDIDNPQDVEVFENPLTGDICMTVVEATVFTSHGFTANTFASVFCINNTDLGFVLVTTIPTRGAVKVRHYLVDGVLHLAIANFVDTSLSSVDTYSEIWIQSGANSFTEAAEARSLAARDILMMEIYDYYYVVIANGFQGTLTNADYDVPVQVYQYNLGSETSLDWRQDLTSYGPLHLDSFSVDSQHFLFVVDKTDTMTVYKYHGALVMFERVKIVPVNGAQSLHVLPVYGTELVHVAVGAYAVEDRFFFEQADIAPLPIDSYILDFMETGSSFETERCS
ncbi:uncharacterized protein LOC117102365 [Anneissia japonica]|uniref:uncharacterized protein LOC117102365 n=1 Tax=Anneissia japonica TaxID=1529436 RepID=UPI00142571DF|nr:uncharacterized protein LOC117102365 [Anneissia japonica]